MSKGVLLFCFNTPFYRYDKIAAKTVPLIKKNLKLPVTIVTNFETFKMLPPLGMINYKIIDNETGNEINKKPWHNLDRWKAYEISPYNTTLLMDIDYFCFSDGLLTYTDVKDDFQIHDDVYDVTGRNSYNFRRNSIIPMLWATVIVFRKSDRAKKIFDMVGYIKKNYQHYCSLYRIDFRNFRNDYAFSIALHQLDGFVPTKKLPTKLPTLPANAKVTSFGEDAIGWKHGDLRGVISNTDVHVIDKGVAYV